MDCADAPRLTASWQLPWSEARGASGAYGRRMTGSDRDALRQLVEEGNEEAADRLAALAAGEGDVETLKYLIDYGNESAADKLAEIAAEKGDAVTLQRLADEGSEVAQELLSRVIGETQ